MPLIFLSSMHSDVTGCIYDRLVAHFGKEQIFEDVQSIPLCIDSRSDLEYEVSQCQVLIAVIGLNWLSAVDAND